VCSSRTSSRRHDGAVMLCMRSCKRLDVPTAASELPRGLPRTRRPGSADIGFRLVPGSMLLAPELGGERGCKTGPFRLLHATAGTLLTTASIPADRPRGAAAGAVRIAVVPAGTPVQIAFAVVALSENIVHLYLGPHGRTNTLSKHRRNEAGHGRAGSGTAFASVRLCHGLVAKP
jgi:hypothetical protein